MIPKIIIRNSRLHDEMLLRKEAVIVPTPDEIQWYIRFLQKRWAKFGPAALRSIARATGLSWHQKEIVCYVTYGTHAYSDPLTISIRKDKEGVFQTLIHELIHRLLSEPEHEIVKNPGWQKIMHKHNKESRRTKTHIVVHAVHEYVFRTIFDEGTLRREIKRASPYPAYARAWELVQREGYKNILQELRS